VSVYRKPKGIDYARSGAILVAFVIALTGSCLVLILTLGTIGFLIWLLLLVPVLLGGIVLWHARSTAYRCPECGNEFTIPTWKDLITPHSLNKYRLRCPRCKKNSWMLVLVRDK